eukprot:GHRR01013734.1.p1 GENE.GHRR01013734.1~~GHRR01013734.1.p1  ORF type:complete len:116 (+),score=20.09 GHRR01013734.1:351-698(+)
MNNTYGTHVMLEAARMTGTINRFINVSTDEVYGETSLGKEDGEQARVAGTWDSLDCCIPLVVTTTCYPLVRLYKSLKQCHVMLNALKATLLPRAVASTCGVWQELVQLGPATSAK